MLNIKIMVLIPKMLLDFSFSVGGVALNDTHNGISPAPGWCLLGIKGAICKNFSLKHSQQLFFIIFLYNIAEMPVKVSMLSSEPLASYLKKWYSDSRQHQHVLRAPVWTRLTVLTSHNWRYAALSFGVYIWQVSNSYILLHLFCFLDFPLCLKQCDLNSKICAGLVSVTPDPSQLASAETLEGKL